MKSVRFVIADVFTEKRFGGNQLAVFLEASGLDTATMQDIAREMNYSETTFLLPPESGGDYRIRIFTPARELPFAGHPLVGSAYVIVSEGMKSSPVPPTVVKLETGVGLIEVEVTVLSDSAGEVTMTQPLPVPKRTLGDRSAVARALSLDPSQISDGASPVEAIYNGLTVLIVPVESLDAVRRVKVDAGALEALASKAGADTVLVFTRETVRAESTVHCRVFAPGPGIGEDAATGSANGPLGYYLVRHELLKGGTSPASIVSEQGYEMNRPSKLLVEVAFEQTTKEATRVRVGGGVVTAGRGEIVLS